MTNDIDCSECNNGTPDPLSCDKCGAWLCYNCATTDSDLTAICHKCLGEL